MDKVKIGIPRGIHYYYYGTFWQNLFAYLNIDIVLSPETNRAIIKKGEEISPDEMCLSMKIYLGHIDYLKDKCDYILIPRIDRYDDKNQTCTNFLVLYDLVSHLFDVKVLNYNIDNKNNLLDGIIEIGNVLKINRYKLLKAYSYACMKTEKYYEHLHEIQKNMLELDNKKVLIVSHAYNIHDEFIGKPIYKIFKKNDIDVLYSDYFNPKITNKLSTNFSENLYWKNSRDSIGSISLCENVDGIIFFSTFPCGLDSLVNELVMRKINKPYINIVIDDLTSLTGIETRIESFVDLIV